MSPKDFGIPLPSGHKGAQNLLHSWRYINTVTVTFDLSRMYSINVQDTCRLPQFSSDLHVSSPVASPSQRPRIQATPGSPTLTRTYGSCFSSLGIPTPILFHRWFADGSTGSIHWRRRTQKQRKIVPVVGLSRALHRVR